MKSGIVKWFNNAKGYGFILPDSGDSDIFAHYSSIDMDGYRTLKAGQQVLFDTISGPKGLHATNIRSSNDDAEHEQETESANESELEQAQQVRTENSNE